MEQVEGGVGLAFELLLANLKLGARWFLHMYAYIYAYFKPAKSACQAEKVKNATRRNGKELNYYGSNGKRLGSHLDIQHFDL